MGGPVLSSAPVAEFVSYMVPGLIYFVNNNCQFYILQAIDPTSFQLLSQLKTIFTGVLFRALLKRKLALVQWLALVILACGTAVSQLKLVQDVEDRHQSLKGLPLPGLLKEQHPELVGISLCLMTSLLSALAGVYAEKLLKDRASASIHWQNIQLYIWGVLFNAIGLYMKDGDTVREHGLLNGFNTIAYLVVFCNAFTGLSISFVLKFADNIARVYAHAIAMMLTMTVSVKLLGVPMTPQMLIAIILVSVSTLEYNLTPSQLMTGAEAEQASRDIDARSVRSEGQREHGDEACKLIESNGHRESRADEP